jgi:hypothetical protein
MTIQNHKTKIVATIGPASDSPQMLERLMRAGLNIARLNFSHGDFTKHGEVIARIRAAARATGRRVAIMADLPGPKMRLGKIERRGRAEHDEDRGHEEVQPRGVGQVLQRRRGEEEREKHPDGREDPDGVDGRTQGDYHVEEEVGLKDDEQPRDHGDSHEWKYPQLNAPR